MEHQFYVETCELIGVEPKRKKDISVPSPIPDEKSKDAEEDALLNNSLYKDMNFHVLNIKHFVNKKDAFVAHVKMYKPHAIIIDWCYSKDGDVANVLMASGILSEMRLTFERTSIVGMSNTWISLDDKQKDVLAEVALLIGSKNRDTTPKDMLSQQVTTGIHENKFKLRHVVLWGGHGTGKTVLGIEIAKMFMSNLKKQNLEYDVYILDCNCDFDNNKDKKCNLLKYVKTELLGKEGFCKERKCWTFKSFEKEIGDTIKFNEHILKKIIS